MEISIKAFFGRRPLEKGKTPVDDVGENRCDDGTKQETRMLTALDDRCVQ